MQITAVLLTHIPLAFRTKFKLLSRATIVYFAHTGLLSAFLAHSFSCLGRSFELVLLSLAQSLPRAGLVSVLTSQPKVTGSKRPYVKTLCKVTILLQ